MRLGIGYPSEEAEETMLVELDRHDLLQQVECVSSLEELVGLQEKVGEVHVHPVVRQYIVRAVAATRESSDFALGAGPRATIAVFRACQALAGISGRSFVLPDDAKRLLPVVLSHRLILSTEGRLKRRGIVEALEETLETIPAPVVGPEGVVQEVSTPAEAAEAGPEVAEEAG